MTKRKSIISIGVLLIAAVILSTAAYGNRMDLHIITTPATIQETAQTATIEVTAKGFEPSSLKLKTDVPAKVTFVRKTDETCAKEVVMKDYNIKRDLPLNEPVTIDFTPRKGEFSFACGMNMIRGKLIVE